MKKIILISAFVLSTQAFAGVEGVTKLFGISGSNTAEYVSFKAGYRVLLDGQDAAIYGHEVGSGIITVDRNSTHVLVDVVQAGKYFTEDWQIVRNRDSGYSFFRRPNGQYVEAYR